MIQRDVWYMSEREPRRQMTADLNSRETLNLQRSQNKVLLYGMSAINDASLLNTTVVVDSNPPAVGLFYVDYTVYSESCGSDETGPLSKLELLEKFLVHIHVCTVPPYRIFTNVRTYV